MKTSTVVLATVLLMAIDLSESVLKEQALNAIKKCRLSLGRTCPDPAFVQFHLFTRQNRKASQLVQVTESRDNLGKTFFNPGHPNKVIIHGFNPRLYREALVSIKEAYLEREEANVWMVNWSKLAAGGTCIPFSVRNTDHVARCVAQLIAAIERHSQQPSVHVISDREGVRVAHTLSYASKHLRLDRITGLNPTGGIIPTQKDDRRLSSMDAEFVDTIHTSPLLPKTEIFGQIDFYLNPSGIHQPGCEKETENHFNCDQRRALEYFAESITSEVGFLAWKCNSYTNYLLGICNPLPNLETMGDKCSLQASGIYITYTAAEPPYALGHWQQKLYQEKGPKQRTDKLSRYSTTIKRKIDQVDENTPEIIKEFGLVDQLRSNFNDKAQDLKTSTINIGLKHVKSVTSHIFKKKGLETVEKTSDLVTEVETVE